MYQTVLEGSRPWLQAWPPKPAWEHFVDSHPGSERSPGDWVLSRKESGLCLPGAQEEARCVEGRICLDVLGKVDVEIMQLSVIVAPYNGYCYSEVLLPLFWSCRTVKFSRCTSRLQLASGRISQLRIIHEDTCFSLTTRKLQAPTDNSC